MSEAKQVFVLLTPGKQRTFFVATALGAICLIAVTCNASYGPSPVGWWRSSGYPSLSPKKVVYLEIKDNGEYSYSSLAGHGTWTMRGNLLTLNPFPGAQGEEFTVESKYKLLRNTITHGVNFGPLVGKPARPWLGVATATPLD